MIMERLNFSNIWYVLSLVFLFAIPVILYFILRNKSDKTIKITLLVLAFGNFSLHFLKILHPSYLSNINYSLIRISLENICGVSTVLLPFAMLCKNKTIKGYFYLISLLGGLMAVVLTTDPNGKYVFQFDTIRYYVCHYVLFSLPILAVTLKEFKPNFKSSIWMPLMFFIGQTIIFVNEIILSYAGLVNHTPESFLSGDFRNAAFVFGPNTEFKSIVDTFHFLVPDIFTKNIFGIEGVGDFYWPVIWLLVPVVLFFPLGYFLFTLPFTHDDVKNYVAEKKLILFKKKVGDANEEGKD